MKEELRIARVDAAVVALAEMRIYEVPPVHAHRPPHEAVPPAPARGVRTVVDERTVQPRKLRCHPGIVAAGLPGDPDAFRVDKLGIGQYRNAPHDEAPAAVAATHPAPPGALR